MVKKKKWLLLVALLAACVVHSQEIKKYAIGNSGCSLYMFCDPGKFDLSYSDDSSKIHTGECNADNFTYGVICVNLKNTVNEMDDAEKLLESYLDFLKQLFKIREATGYGMGSRLMEREDTRGIIDYWDDEDKNKWVVQGWTDGKVIAVLYVKGTTHPDFNKQQVYFKGFRLPGMQL